MKILEALELREREVISFVGGLGKTGFMFRVADELGMLGKRVITAATVAGIPVWPGWGEYMIIAHDPDTAEELVRKALPEHRHITLVGSSASNGRMGGVPVEVIERVSQIEDVDYVLVEADFSHRKDFKAPAEDEPIIPGSTTMVVSLLNAPVIGKPVNEIIVYNADAIAEMAEQPIFTPITPRTIARVMIHENGGLKNVPDEARFVPVVNRCDTEKRLSSGVELADKLLKYKRVERVVLADTGKKDPVIATRKRVAAAILAAGGSRRMGGKPKQLLPWGDKTLIEHILDQVEQVNFAEIVVVLGHEAEKVKEVLEDRPVKVVVNPDWEIGISTSIKAAVNALPEDTDAVMFIHSDQPGLTPDILKRIRWQYEATNRPVVYASYYGEQGLPVLFDKRLFPELLALRYTEGGKEVVRRYAYVSLSVPVIESWRGEDIDTAEDYSRWMLTHPYYSTKR